MNKNLKILSSVLAVLSVFGCLGACESKIDKEELFCGLYDNIETKEIVYTYNKDNMMYDFEEEESIHRKLYFNNLCGSVSFNTDPKYITCGRGSLKCRVDGRADKGYWSMLYFIFDEKFSDFTKIEYINFDILYETSDGSDRAYSIGGTASRNDRFETENTVWAKSGEWYNFRVYPNDVLYAASTGLVFEWGVKMKKEYLSTMNNLYLSFKPFTQGQQPITVYLDNIYVKYFE